MSRFGRGMYSGKRVKQGDVIGYVGTTGRSTGPHLHYEVWYEGKVRDPLAFLDAGKQIFNIAETISTEAN